MTASADRRPGAPPGMAFHHPPPLPQIAALIDGRLAGAEEHHRTLGEARGPPGTLDDETMQRVVRVFTEEVESAGEART
jgi:hypothetical protein